MKKFTSVCFVLLFAVSVFAQTITVAEAIAIGLAQTENNVPTEETYTVEGYVNFIDKNEFNTSYNNMTFWIADTRGTANSSALGALQCYRCRPDRELEVGDKVRVVTQLRKYYSTVETYPTNAPATWLESQPEPETGSLRVCAQNLNNYYYNYTQSTRPSYSDEAGFQEKTQKIVNAMLDIDADIYAFCEVEATPIALQHLAEAMSAQAGEAGRYVAVSDGIDYTWYEGISDNQIKSGFIYRTDRVKTYGSNTSAVSGNGYYAHTMRLQVFEQKENGERLVISMNHFKAKDSSSDQGASMRETNATNLLNALKKVSVDPDILILGDLNCQYGETPITMLINAGYEEQLLKYDPSAWSHCYGSGELIDHVLANASMADQIVNAYVKHVSAYKCNSAVNSWQSWSDHDPYVVEINLSTEPAEEGPCEDIDVTYLTSSLDPLTSVNNIWYWNSGGYAKAQKQGGYTDCMLTPEMNLSEMSSATISFQHTHKWAGTPSEELTLWVTPDFQGDVESSTWYQLTISPYAANTDWKFVDASIDVPVEYLGSNTVFAFKYMSTATNYATWEIKNLKIKATCSSAQPIENVADESAAYKEIRHGQLIIIRSGVEYTVTGQRVR
ncbi:MAG: choice-of-anchor J domain-containing protein [Paludibacteraceae bacterium]|nr:choice-of-anchor J domain-containing protein [Paludibacteraceae bacterium]